MGQIKKKKLKKPIKLLILLVLILSFFLTIPLCLKIMNENKLSTLKYDKVAIKNILNNNQEKYIYKVGYKETLNEAFKSKDFKKSNLEHYKNIDYKSQKNLIKNINSLIDKGYSDKEISLLVKQSTDESLSSFTLKDKVDDVSDYFIFPYAKLENYDRYVLYQLKEREDEENTVTRVNLGLDKPFYTDAIEITTYDEKMLTNKYRVLAKSYEPKNLESFDKEYCVDKEKQYANEVVKQAFEQMAKDAKANGFNILVNSSYRSYDEQEKIYNLYKDTYGEKYAENAVAKPGYSEHQTGLVLDIASNSGSIFKETKEYKWMLDNGYKYGFTLRYPKNKENVTGYKNEAWHYRYVGKEIALYLEKNNLTFDEYYIRFLDKN